MKIRDLFEKVSGLPEHINVIKEGKHPYIGYYKDAPKEILDSEIISASIERKPWVEKEQIFFYI